MELVIQFFITLDIIKILCLTPILNWNGIY